MAQDTGMLSGLRDFTLRAPRLRRPQGLAAIMACLTLFSLTQGLSYPLLSLRLERAGHDEAAIGLASSMGPLGVLLSSFLLPAAVRWLGTRQVVLITSLMGAAVWLLYPVFDSYNAWLPLRFVQGVSASCAYIIGEIWLNQTVTPERRARSIALYGTVLSAGFAIGPLLLALLGSEGANAFIAGAIGCLITFLMVWLLGGDLPNRPEAAPEGKGGTLTIWRSIWPLILVVTIISFYDQAVLSLVPVYGVTEGMDERTAALMVTVMVVGNILLQLPLGHVADRVTPARVMMACGFLGAAASMALPFLIAQSWLAWPLLFFWGAVGFSIYNLSLAELGQRFTDERLVAGSAAYGIAWGIGGLLGPGMTGAAMALVGNDGLFWILAVSLASIGFLMLAQRRGS